MTSTCEDKAVCHFSYRYKSNIYVNRKALQFPSPPLPPFHVEDVCSQNMVYFLHHHYNLEAVGQFLVEELRDLYGQVPVPK